MQFDIELVTAEFIFLMNTISVLESFLSWQTTERISDRVTYILVLWLLNPSVHVFLNAHLSPVLDWLRSVPFWRWWQTAYIVQEWFVATKSTLKSKIDWVVHGCLSLRKYNSMKHSCFWLLSGPSWVVPIWERRHHLYLHSFLCMRKDVKIHKE